MENPSELKEIIELSDSIRKKYESLKRGHADTEVMLQKTFKPIVDPLQMLVKEKKIKRKKRMEPKQEVKSEHDDVFLEQDADDEKFPEHRGVLPRPLKLETLAESKPATDSVLEDMMSTPAGIEYVQTMLNQYGPLASKYMTLYVADDKTIDKSYHGLKYVDNEWKFGNKTFNVDEEDNIYIDGKKHEGTRGLFELIFVKDPDKNIVSQSDYDTYLEILKSASVLKRRYNPVGPAQGSRTKKYMTIIAPHLRTKSGTGLVKHYNKNVPDLMYWDDPNELVERLMLLVASRDAGHSNHDNEILSIQEELRESGYIE